MMFVGRTDELALLAGELEKAARGQPRVVLVDGEAGVGKSSLLSRFASGLDRARVLRAGGEESEMLLAFGVLEQLAGRGLQQAGGGFAPSALAAGAELVGMLSGVEDQSDCPVVVVVDDLHWADLESASALLFAFRRLRADRVLALVSARPGALARLGEGWARFIAGDDRVVRLALAGFGAEELRALARVIGVGELPTGAVGSLLEHTGGNPLYCRALLEELDVEDLVGGANHGIPAPRALASVIISRVSGLSAPARELVLAASVLGLRGRLAVACQLAGLAHPGQALEEVEAADLLVERRGPLGSELVFAHPLIHRAVYDDLPASTRRELHTRAAELVDRSAALDHRVAAAAVADAALARELEEAAGEAAAAGRMTRASSWLVRAAALSADTADRERRLLGALEQLLSVGDVAEAASVEREVRGLGASARASGLLGHLALLRGDGMRAERLLLEAWERHDQSTEPLVGAAAAVQLTHYHTVAGRAAESLTWAQRAINSTEEGSELQLVSLVLAAVALAFLGRPGDGLDRLAFLPKAAGEAPIGASDALVHRGILRLWTDQVRAGLYDLQRAAARMRDGTPLRFASQCLAFLGEASFRIGAWDDAVVHTELAVSLSRDTDRVWDLPFVHAYATLVPAHRGDWEVASSHASVAVAAAAESGLPLPIAVSNTAAAMLAAARSDHAGVLEASAAIRAAGRLEVLGRPGIYNWRALEVDALIASGRLAEAQTALDEFEASIPAGGLPSASVALARLQGTLTATHGDHDAAAHHFEAASRLSTRLDQPFELALLGLTDARRLRQTGDRRAAIARLRQSRDGFTALRARPYVEACDRELERCGVRTGRDGSAAGHGLTQAELAVARLVVTGKTNRETAAELYVTVKTVEFHLRGVFAKLGINSRSEIAAKLGPPRSGR
jgi:DNA-binding CsgD family transcriptional regulator/uncharacterized protein GlcG (DUF336 family)